MKKFLITICACIGLCNATFATTVNYNWLVDGTNYAQTTCETGDDLILPTPTPTKYGYHFVGWVESEIFGSWSRSGTPTPQNPIEPVFKPFLNTVLRAVGNGDNFVADSYNPETRTITRRIGVKVFNGTESWDVGSFNSYPTLFITISDVFSNMAQIGSPYNKNLPLILSHFIRVTCNSNDSTWVNNVQGAVAAGGQYFGVRWGNNDSIAVADFKQWLASQYAAGTPVTVYYPLKTPTEERIQ